VACSTVIKSTAIDLIVATSVTVPFVSLRYRMRQILYRHIRHIEFPFPQSRRQFWQRIKRLFLPLANLVMNILLRLAVLPCR
jgi:hypothetical protein